MSKKTFATIGMVVSAVIVFMGILVLAGALGGDASHPDSAPYYYDSGYASFGGDFYTYVNNNAAESADASYTAANNIRKLCELLKNVFGVSMMGFGLLGICHFGILRCGCAENEQAPAQNAPVVPEFPPLPETEPVPLPEAGAEAEVPASPAE